MTTPTEFPVTMIVPDPTAMRDWVVEQFTGSVIEGIVSYQKDDNRYQTTIVFKDENAATLTKLFWAGRAESV